jgi:integrase
MGAIERLTAKQVEHAKPKRGKRSILLSDGGNLYLQAKRTRDGEDVNRSWIFRYQLPGRPPKDMGLGSTNAVLLVEAREKARTYRGLIAQGIDPIVHRDTQISQNLAKSAVVMNFEQCAESYIKQHRPSWTNPKTERDWKSSLASHVYPTMGKLNVSDIALAHIRKVLDPIWNTQPMLASQVRRRIEAVLDLATTLGLRSGDNPARWSGNLENVFPKVSKMHKTEHRAALDLKEVPAFMVELRKQEIMAALALEFCVLTCVRTDDIRDAKVKDVDVNERVWTIPELSKTHKEHRVPLTDQMIDVLKRIQQIRNMLGGAVASSELLFPNDNQPGAKISKNAMLNVIMAMGYKGKVTTHGFRASFRTWTNDATHFPRNICEVALGHTVGDKTELSYQRGDAFAKRAKVMQAWSSYLDRPTASDKASDKVVPMTRAARA